MHIDINMKNKKLEQEKRRAIKYFKDLSGFDKEILKSYMNIAYYIGRLEK